MRTLYRKRNNVGMELRCLFVPDWYTFCSGAPCLENLIKTTIVAQTTSDEMTEVPPKIQIVSCFCLPLSFAQDFQLKGASVDLSSATYQIYDESHTIGNALRWMIMKKSVRSRVDVVVLSLMIMKSQGRILRVQVSIPTADFARILWLGLLDSSEHALTRSSVCRTPQKTTFT